ncbi:NPCBM/NEW2 domain-containing protein [Streptomyces sp. S4.7]|uniref:NPCBM/NEW2 domain-containing protein n=1 Tax=Streptomyces sp. S4.7 TaxID=2705439 RepID=UPI0013DA455C|nr:NPCBM/NEW2 domain-containing protein [Streptomyces sp. S4.7]
MVTSNSPGGSGGRHSYLKDGAVVGAVAAAVIGALVALFLKYGPEGNDGSDKVAGSPSSVATLPSADGTTPAPPPSEETSSASPSPGADEPSPPGENGDEGPGGSGGAAGSSADPQSPPGPVTSYLSDLDPVGGLGNYKHTGAATVQRTTYGNSVIFSLNSFNGGAKTVTYNVPAGKKEFRATVGLDERTESGCTVFFQVSFDGNPVDSGFTLPVGQTREVVEKIGGAGRLTITVNGVDSPTGKVNGTCRAVWGDARFS